jgi:hypothetical protein
MHLRITSQSSLLMKRILIFHQLLPVLAFITLLSCSADRKMRTAQVPMLYGIPVNSMGGKTITELTLPELASVKVPFDAKMKFFREFDKLRCQFKPMIATAYRTNDIRVLVEAGKRKLYIDKSGCMHEGDQFYRIDSAANNLLKTVVPDSLESKLCFDFVVMQK